MQIEKMTVGDFMELAKLFAAKSEVETSIPIGEKVLIRGVTLYYLGRVESVSAEEVILTDASWVANTGQFSKALKTGILSEVEPYPDGPVIINRGSIADVSLWMWDLPR